MEDRKYSTECKDEGDLGRALERLERVVSGLSCQEDPDRHCLLTRLCSSGDREPFTFRTDEGTVFSFGHSGNFDGYK